MKKHKLITMFLIGSMMLASATSAMADDTEKSETQAIVEAEREDTDNEIIDEIDADSAESGICGEGINWTLDQEGTLKISGIGSIEDHAFEMNGMIKSIVIEEGIEKIGDNAFCKCKYLEEITIPTSMKSIGENAFSECDSLMNVYYNGTQEEWEAVDIGLGNDVLIAEPTDEDEDQTYDDQFEEEVIDSDSEENEPSENEEEIPSGDSETEEVPENTGIIDEENTDSQPEQEIIDPENTIEEDTEISEESEEKTDAEEVEKTNAENGYTADEEEEASEEEGKLYDSAETYSGESGAISWKLSDGVLTISGNGRMSDEGYSAFGWHPYRSSIKSIVVRKGVTYLGVQAFRGCINLESIEIASSVEELGEGLFYGCNSLSSIVLPEKITNIPKGCFVGCRSLEEFTANNAISYCEYAFQETAFTEFTVGPKVESIDGLAFFRAKTKAFKVSANNTAYKSVDGVLFTKNGKTLVAFPGAVEGSYSIPYGVTTIENAAFLNSWIENVDVPESVTTLGASVFQESEIKSICIPDSVTKTGEFTFYNCPYLNSVEFGEGLKETSFKMFRNCVALRNIDFGNTLSKLAADTFAYCSSLESVILPTTVKKIGNGCFGFCTKLQYFEGNGLSVVPYQAFYGDVSLSDVRFGNMLTEVNRAAFLGCTALECIDLPSSVTYVSSLAFPIDTTITGMHADVEPFGTHGYRIVENVAVKGTRDYKSAYKVLELVNQKRAQNGLSGLVMEESLIETAMKRAAETSLLFAHTRPDSSSCFTANELMIAENIAAGQTTPEAAMTSWMNSSGHRANILSTDAKTIGIGCFIINGHYYWVQCFGAEGSAISQNNFASTETAKEKINLAIGEFSMEPDTTNIVWGSDDGPYEYNTADIKLEKNKITKGFETTASFMICNPGNGALTRVTSSSVIWKSGNESVASISSGKILGKGAGTTIITASTKKGYFSTSQKISVNLQAPVIKKAENKLSGVKISWDKISGAEKYQISRRTKEGSWQIIATTTGTSYTDKTIQSKNGVTYYYRVRCVKNNGTSPASSYCSKKMIVRMKSSAVTSVKNTSAGAITVAVKKNSQATAYEIQYSTNSSFASGNKKVVLNNNAGLSKIIKSLKKGKTYYVRVRTYKTVSGNKYYSAWNSGVKIKITR